MKRAFFFSICIVLFCTSCGVADKQKSDALADGYDKVKETDKFVYYCSQQDIQVIQDIDKALEMACPQILKNLDCQYDDKITVEIFPDQSSYDMSLSDKSAAGSPACSGDKTIKMVSPASPIKVQGITYKERINMAVHEYVHLLVDEINDAAPVWMDEGIACHEGSRDTYEEFSRLAFPQLSEITLDKLDDMYYKIPAADIYSYSAVRFIIEVFGYEKFDRILRKPSDMGEILAMDQDELSSEWNSYIKENYRDSVK